jgi:hypothetical protein
VASSYTYGCDPRLAELGLGLLLLGTKGAVMHYLAIGRYNAQGAAGVLKEGLTSRKVILKEFAERDGGRLIGMWGVESADADFVILVEGDLSPALGAATTLGQRSMGHIEELHTYTLVDTEDVDAAIKGTDTVTRAPGAS